jgi:hypothetical protein
MKRVALFLLVLTLLPAAAPAQPRSHGYGYFGPAAVHSRGAETLMTAGGGGEWVQRGTGLGFGGDLGALFSRYGGALGLAQAHVAWHIPVTNSRWDPFVNGGFGVAFNTHGGAGLGHVAGGVQYWITPRIAPRFEIRPTWGLEGGGPPLVQYRFGIAFR